MTGWGRRAAAFAYLIENVHWREYLYLLDQTGVGQGSATSTLPVAAGWLYGWRVNAVPPPLASTPRHGSPLLRRRALLGHDQDSATCFTCHLLMRASMWPRASEASGAIVSVPYVKPTASSVPGGKVGLSFWGNQRRMEAYPLFAVLGQTSQAERDNTGAMVNIGRPGIAEQLMTEAGLVPGTRTSLRLHWEFPDVELAARALASTGPAYLAMQHVGEEAFMASAREAAAGLYVEGIGVRAEVELQFLVGVVPD